MLLTLIEGLLTLCCQSLPLGEEVSDPKAINIKQYLKTKKFPVNNRHFVIKSSQTTRLYITKVFYK